MNTLTRTGVQRRSTCSSCAQGFRTSLPSAVWMRTRCAFLALLQPRHRHTRIHAHTRTHTHKHVRMHTSTHTSIHTCTHASAHIHTHIHIHADARTHTHTHTHGRKHTHIHIHTQCLPHSVLRTSEAAWWMPSSPAGRLTPMSHASTSSCLPLPFCAPSCMPWPGQTRGLMRQVKMPRVIISINQTATYQVQDQVDSCQAKQVIWPQAGPAPASRVRHCCRPACLLFTAAAPQSNQLQSNQTIELIAINCNQSCGLDRRGARVACQGGSKLSLCWPGCALEACCNAAVPAPLLQCPSLLLRPNVGAQPQPQPPVPALTCPPNTRPLPQR